MARLVPARRAQVHAADRAEGGGLCRKPRLQPDLAVLQVQRTRDDGTVLRAQLHGHKGDPKTTRE